MDTLDSTKNANFTSKFAFFDRRDKQRATIKRQTRSKQDIIRYSIQCRTIRASVGFAPWANSSNNTAS